MIAVHRLRELSLSPTLDDQRRHVSAASGLVRVGQTLFVIADDELDLGVFSSVGSEPGRLIRLFDGALPADKVERKKMKPDLEVLTLLPASADHPNGALFALGSGSRPNRCRGAIVRLDGDGHAGGEVSELDLSPLFTLFRSKLEDLNIEGAAVVGDELLLFQRGNRSTANAIIRYPYPEALSAALRPGSDVVTPASMDLVIIDTIDGVPFCFTDAVALENGNIAFCAVAEDTDDAYSDGPCIGAGIGILSGDGKLLSFDRLEHPHKVEGIAAWREDDQLRLLLVTDADDPHTPAILCSASIAA